jgi:predicted ATPase
VAVSLPTGGLIAAEIEWPTVDDDRVFPFTIPAIGSLRRLDLTSPVTFFVGENGSGKSTLLEAIAVAAGINPEGGSRHLRFSTAATESGLPNHLKLVWRTRQRWAFFLRAETFFDTATAYELVDGARTFHDRSHGEQFIDAAMTKFAPGGFHLLDEPEAALSVIGQLKLLRRIHDVVGEGGQFVIATHSPILLAFPEAAIFEFGQRIERIDYEESQPYQLTKSFLESPERFLHHLLRDDDPTDDPADC